MTIRLYSVVTTSYVAKKSKKYAGYFAKSAFNGQVAASVWDLIKAEIRANGIRIPTREDRWKFKI